MFSIIIPLYNKQDSIADTLESVFNQTHTEFEIIVVNDGSSDNSLTIVEAFKDPRLKIYSQENGGVSDARNYGISIAQNEYIAFLDADDSWEPIYLEKMNRLIGKYPGCGMYNCSYRMKMKNKIIDFHTDVQEGIVPVQDYFKQSISNCISFTSATVANKNVFEKAGLFPVGMIGGEDDYMWTKVAIHFPVAYTPEILANYNRNDSTLFSRAGQKDTCKESWEDLYTPDNPYLNKFIATKAILKGIRYVWGGHKAESLKIENKFQYMKKYKDFDHKWHKLFILNRLPAIVRNMLLLYKKVTSH